MIDPGPRNGHLLEAATTKKLPWNPTRVALQSLLQNRKTSAAVTSASGIANASFHHASAATGWFVQHEQPGATGRDGCARPLPNRLPA